MTTPAVLDVVAEPGPVTLATSRVPITLTCESPLHHGAGAAGNTALLRTQQVVLPDGRQTAVPFVSGNSLRHAIRDALAWRLVRVLDIPEHSLTKGVVDLLWSGGALTKTGNQVELAQQRALTEGVPALALLGYSAQSDIVHGCLRVDNLNLLCEENSWRLPPHLDGHAHAAVKAGVFRDEEFGTRHDITGSAPAAMVADTGMFDTAPATTQMIFEHQVLLPGAVLWGALTLEAASPLAADALHAALAQLAPDGRMFVAARRASGWGVCRLALHDGTSIDVEAGSRHDEHLRGHRAVILDALSAAAS